MSGRNFYDETLKALFRHPRFVRSLLEHFVAEPWVALLEVDQFSVESGEFTGLVEDKREADLLLRFPVKVGPELYVFLLLEFQRTNVPMGLRLLEYLTRIYRRHMDRFGRLPVVAPVVIYNGKGPWRDCPYFSSRFVVSHETLRPYIPEFRYLLIDTAHLPERSLLALRDEVSYLFLIDRTDIAHRDEAVARIIGLLKELAVKDSELYRMLAGYVSGLLAWKGVTDERVESFIHEGGSNMLAQSIDRLKRQERQEGKREGKREGEREAKRKVVGKMLADGLPIDRISSYTGLSVDEILQMKQKT